MCLEGFWWCGKKDTDARMAWCSEACKTAHRARERAANPYARKVLTPQSIPCKVES